jgi:hypothetical protein
VYPGLVPFIQERFPHRILPKTATRFHIKAQGGEALPSNGFCPLRRGFPTCFSLAFVSSFAEAGREARLKPALFLREYSLSPTG